MLTLSIVQGLLGMAEQSLFIVLFSESVYHLTTTRSKDGNIFYEYMEVSIDESDDQYFSCST